MKVKCSRCESIIELTDSQSSFINECISNDMSFCMIQCNKCGVDFAYDINDTADEFELIWRTPILGSHGYVSFINDDEPFYGCSETGAIWKSKKSFFKDIEKSIEKYPHRKLFYKFHEEEWLPVDKEPENIEELIDSEDIEEIDSYSRD